MPLPFGSVWPAQSKGGSTPEFLSTHPADATRIADIQNRIPEAMKYYHR
jgi:predicted Zn-dependent protease